MYYAKSRATLHFVQLSSTDPPRPAPHLARVEADKSRKDRLKRVRVVVVVVVAIVP